MAGGVACESVVHALTFLTVQEICLCEQGLCQLGNHTVRFAHPFCIVSKQLQNAVDPKIWQEVYRLLWKQSARNGRPLSTEDAICQRVDQETKFILHGKNPLLWVSNLVADHLSCTSLARSFGTNVYRIPWRCQAPVS